MINQIYHHLWELQDKNDLELLQKEIIKTREHFLLIKENLKKIINNSKEIDINEIEEETVKWVFFQESKLVPLKKSMEKIKEKIIKNLESKKINKFWNSLLVLVTFGKINKNKRVDYEIENFIYTHNEIKQKYKIIKKNLIKLTNDYFFSAIQKSAEKEKELDNYIKINKKNRLEIDKNEAKIIKLEITAREYKNQLDCFMTKNMEYKQIQEQYNEKCISKYQTLENKIKQQEKEIDELKKINEELEKNQKLTDDKSSQKIEMKKTNKPKLETKIINELQNKSNKRNILRRIINFNYL